jgi:molecular chaperone HtpG
MATTEAPERLEFKTELKQLLDLIIHSLYTKREIFLRELVSNAADAIDKLRFNALTHPELAEGDTDYKIKIIPNREAGTLTVSDNGIGMTRAEVVENLGTIARSGTRAFLENLKKAQAENRPELIGQFGVGFYASFMVADKVTVITRAAAHPPDQAVKWESDGQGAYTIESTTKESRGTDVVVHLREDSKEFLDAWRIKEIVHQYSNFIDSPIVLVDETDKDGKKVVTEEVINAQQALWLRNKNEIKPDEYNALYRQISRDFEDPLKVIHIAAEGAMEFRAILFVPARRPLDFYMGPEAKSGVDLYVKRVLIKHNAEGLLPTWLRFIKGVVDSSDLPLNVSRETLQHNAIIARIRSNLTNRVLKTLEEMRDSEYDKYLQFYKEFGQVLKEGAIQEFANRDRILELLLFESTKTKPGEYTTLPKYVANMPSDQKEIYYLVGESRELLENSPYLETFKARGWEVLFLTDPIDEFLADGVREYKDKPLTAVDRAKLDTDPETDKQLKEAGEQLKGVLDLLKAKLSDEVKDVRVSPRLKDSPAVLVADEHAMSAHMERLMQRMGRAGEGTGAKRILELNPQHPAVQTLQKLLSSNPQDPRIDSIARLLYDQALIAEGSKIKDPSAFSKRLTDLITASA